MTGPRGVRGRFGRELAGAMETNANPPRPVNRPDLARALQERNPGLRQSEVRNIVSLVLDEIAGALAEGGRAELRGFGSFSVKDRPPRKGRNPRTGETVAVGRKFTPFFRASRQLIGRVNGWR